MEEAKSLLANWGSELVAGGSLRRRQVGKYGKGLKVRKGIDSQATGQGKKGPGVIGACPVQDAVTGTRERAASDHLVRANGSECPTGMEPFDGPTVGRYPKRSTPWTC